MDYALTKSIITENSRKSRMARNNCKMVIEYTSD